MSNTQQHTLTLRLPSGVYHNAVMSFHQYGASGRTALAFKTQDGEPLAVATVNLPNTYLEPDEVIIKNWSENEGMTASLEEAGIIGPVIDAVATGFVTATIHKLLVQPVFEEGT